MDGISYAVAFGGGLLTFLSPCVLPLVPVYLASLTGPEIFEHSDRRRFKIFFHAFSFVIGFALVFTFLGAGLGLVGFSFSEHAVLIRKISGGLLIFFGIFLLASQKVRWLNFEKRLNPGQVKSVGYLRSLLTGGIFSLAWTPCAGPVLGGILMLAMDSQTAYRGASLLAVYSLGIGFPFLIFGAAFEPLAPFLKRIQRYSFVFYVVSSLLLITVGILILTNHLSLLQGANF